MHARHTALPVSVPCSLQLVEAGFERVSIHHVHIVTICVFDGFVNRTAIEETAWPQLTVNLTHQNPYIKI